MRYDQTELGEQFRNGETSGYASNVHIADFPVLGETALVGYGHAVYATRDKKTGHVVAYDGWRSKSRSSAAAMTKLGLKGADERREERRSLAGMCVSEEATEIMLETPHEVQEGIL